MNDDRLLLEMRRWLQEERVALPHAEEAGRQIATHLPTTKQRRRRRWRLPFAGRPAVAPTAADTTEYQPSSIPATNGHSPTVIGRTTSMLSPVKAIAAGAIVFALGGAFLITQPFGLQSSAPGAVEPAAPVAVSGTGSPGPCPSVGTVEKGHVYDSTRDGYCNPSWVMSDERLTGTVTWATNEDRYLDDSGLLVRVLGVSVVNDEGSWRMQPEVQFGRRAVIEGLPSQFVLVGDGAYDGLYAVLAWDGSLKLSGFILSGGLPPEPAVLTAS